MALSNLSGWNNEAAPAAACGSACGAGDKPEEKPTACGSACGAVDKPEEKPAARLVEREVNNSASGYLDRLAVCE